MAKNRSKIKKAATKMLASRSSRGLEKRTPLKKGGSVIKAMGNALGRPLLKPSTSAAAKKPGFLTKHPAIATGLAAAVGIAGGVVAARAIGKMRGKGSAGAAAAAIGFSGRRRRGVVPKTVRKWAGKISRRRAQEEKIVKKLFGAGGGKIIKAPKKTSSSGVITKAEALAALRS